MRDLRSGFLSASLRSCAEKETGRFASQGLCSPKATCRVEEGLHLSTHHAIASGESEEYAVRVRQLSSLNDRNIGFGGRMHFSQHFRRESFGDLQCGNRETEAFRPLSRPLLLLCSQVSRPPGATTKKRPSHGLRGARTYLATILYK